MLKKIIFISSISLILGCKSYAPLSSRIELPPINYFHNESIIKTNGYYFSEEIMDISCYKYDKTSQTSERETHSAKTVDIVVLYKSGASIVTLNSLWAGVPSTYWEDCNFPDSLNTYKKAKEDFEYFVKEIEPKDRIDGKNYHGVFHIKDQEKIHFSIYHNISRLSSNSYVGFYDGEIINDTTFVMKKRWINRKEDTDFREKVFRFHETHIKPDKKNFMLENRHRFRN